MINSGVKGSKAFPCRELTEERVPALGAGSPRLIIAWVAGSSGELGCSELAEKGSGSGSSAGSPY